MSFKIGFIGCGNMGGAIAKSVSAMEGSEVFLFDSDSAKASALAKMCGPNASVAQSIPSLKDSCNVLLLAVKPQILPQVLELLGKEDNPERLYISIAAGIPLNYLNNYLKINNIIRFMPNLAASEQKAVTAVAAFSSCPEKHITLAMSIAQSFGSAFSLAESLFPAFIGISGSAIAYIFAFMHSLAMGGTEEGIPYPQALEIARDTMESAVVLQKKSKRNPIDLATSVCSAGGTTIEGMKVLACNSFEGTVMEAVSAAADKSRELESLTK